MHNIVKINRINYPQIYDENIDKYLFVDENENIIGLATINDKLEYNKINISIEEEFQGNGYGKELFKLILDEYKNNTDTKELIFKIDGKNLFTNILYGFGAINVDNDNGVLEFVLPLR